MDDKTLISYWVKTLSTETIKIFPKDFTIPCDCVSFNLPRKGLLIGKEFFGETELIDAEGSEVLKVDSYEKAKFIIYANRNKPSIVSIPLNQSAIREMNSKYEIYIDSIIKRIDRDYRNKFPGRKNFTETISQIFNHLNLIRLK